MAKNEQKIRQGRKLLTEGDAFCLVFLTPKEMAASLGISQKKASTWLKENSGWTTDWLRDQLAECVAANYPKVLA